jgi:hypothetical protein
MATSVVISRGSQWLILIERVGAVVCGTAPEVLPAVGSSIVCVHFSSD